MKQLKDIRENYKDLEVIFIFLDKVTFEMIKCSIDIEEGINEAELMIFIDYNDDAEYYVPLNKANKILDYCYTEYFFKALLFDSDFYKKVKAVSLELEIEPFIFDLFFRSFFLAIKDRFNSNIRNDYHFNRSMVYRIVSRAPSDSFDNYPIMDFEDEDEGYFDLSKKLLEKLEDLGIISFFNNDITKDEKLQNYFAISCDTFKFYPNKREPEFEFFSPIFEFFDLKLFLNNQDYLRCNLLQKLDRSIQLIILTCFKNVRFYNNILSDNSYIKKFNLDRQLVNNKFIIINK